MGGSSWKARTKANEPSVEKRPDSRSRIQDASKVPLNTEENDEISQYLKGERGEKLHTC